MLSYVQALNGTLALQANVNQTNTSYLLTTNNTYAYALNDSLWSLNYSNFSIGWLYATNSTGADSFIANYSTFLTHITWANVVNGTMLSYVQALNGTLALQANVNQTNTSYYLATNPFGFYNSTNPPPADAETLWNANYSNFSIGWLYATNSTGADSFIANYSTFLTHITWAKVVNGTMLSYVQALNGTLALQANVNQTNTSYLLTTNNTYAYALNDSLWSLNYSNFSIGWLYATNLKGRNYFHGKYLKIPNPFGLVKVGKWTKVSFFQGFNGTLALQA